MKFIWDFEFKKEKDLEKIWVPEITLKELDVGDTKLATLPKFSASLMHGMEGREPEYDWKSNSFLSEGQNVVLNLEKDYRLSHLWGNIHNPRYGPCLSPKFF